MTRCSACGCAVVGASSPTAAEARVLAFILEHHARCARFPTYHAIRSGLHLRSVNSVVQQLRGLAVKGLITIEPYRGIRAARRPD